LDSVQLKDPNVPTNGVAHHLWKESLELLSTN